MKNKLKFIPVNVPKLYKQEKTNVIECIKTNWISSEGKFVKDFEANFAKFNQRKYGIAVSSGTAALEIAVKSLSLKFMILLKELFMMLLHQKIIHGKIMLHM